jgi:hypothetical protein
MASCAPEAEVADLESHVLFGSRFAADHKDVFRLQIPALQVSNVTLKPSTFQNDQTKHTDRGSQPGERGEGRQGWEGNDQHGRPVDHAMCVQILDPVEHL